MDINNEIEEVNMRTADNLEEINKIRDRARKMDFASKQDKVRDFFNIHIKAFLQINKLLKIELKAGHDYEDRNLDDIDYLRLLNITFASFLVFTFPIAFKVISVTMFSPLAFLGVIALSIPLFYAICNFRIIDSIKEVSQKNIINIVDIKDLKKYAIFALLGSGIFVFLITFTFLYMSIQ